MTTATAQDGALAESDSSRSRQAERVKDARGRQVAQLDPVALYLLRRRDVIMAEPLDQIVHDLTKGQKKKRRCLSFFIYGEDPREFACQGSAHLAARAVSDTLLPNEIVAAGRSRTIPGGS